MDLIFNSQLGLRASSPGRLRNKYFLLSANRLVLESDTGSQTLATAYADGNVEIHLLNADEDTVQIIKAESAVYDAKRQSLKLTGMCAVEDGVWNDAYQAEEVEGIVHLPVSNANGELKEAA